MLPLSIILVLIGILVIMICQKPIIEGIDSSPGDESDAESEEPNQIRDFLQQLKDILGIEGDIGGESLEECSSYDFPDDCGSLINTDDWSYGSDWNFEYTSNSSSRDRCATCFSCKTGIMPRNSSNPYYGHYCDALAAGCVQDRTNPTYEASYYAFRSTDWNSQCSDPSPADSAVCSLINSPGKSLADALTMSSYIDCYRKVGLDFF